MSITQMAKEAGLHPSTVHNRIRRGMSVDEALSKRPFYDASKRQPKDKYSFRDGLTRKEWAEKIGITVESFNQRVRRYGEVDDRSYAAGHLPKGRSAEDIGNAEWGALSDKDRSKNLLKIRPLGTWEREQ